MERAAFINVDEAVFSYIQNEKCQMFAERLQKKVNSDSERIISTAINLGSKLINSVILNILGKVIYKKEQKLLHTEQIP